MSETKHTPGPWEAIEWTAHARTTVVTEEWATAVKAGKYFTGGAVIADCKGALSGYLDAEAEANARLIAAAPELLEALEHSKNRADEIFKAMIQFVGHAADCRYHGTDSPEGDVCVCRVESRIRELKHMLTRNTNECEAAIRKAKGQL